MPKRLCPFDYEFLPQIKIHISDKKVNVRSDSQMKSVYDKTLAMLFKGAKCAASKSETAIRDHPATNPSHNKGVHGYKQLFMTSEGRLQSTGTLQEHQLITLCGDCSSRSDIPFRCSFCDKNQCTACIRTCSSCGDAFCNVCRLSVFYPEESYMCLECFK